MRIRATLIIIGFMLVLFTYTFPFWQPLVFQTPESVEILFPGLPLNLQSAFASLPPDQQRTYLEFARADTPGTVRMVMAALEPRVPLPEEDQEMPEMIAAQPIAAGRFTALDPVRWGQGRVTIFQDTENRFLLRFEDFSMLGGVDLRVAFSPAEAPTTVEAMRVGEVEFLEVSPLLSSMGNQNYELPEGFTLVPYRSVVIYSGALNRVYTVAPLAVRQ
ncbi:MAG: DM13 domain-containing protein [Chloroflexota bacterium]|nr:DM13 domain-containing protein [Chloroflexota bacterium]